MEKCGRARQATYDSIIRRIHFACCITKVTDTHSECVRLIAFPLQQVLLLYIACLVSEIKRAIRYTKVYSMCGT